MLKKRITLIVMFALVSTSTPFLYQYVIEPRVDGANVSLEINSMLYNGDESGDEATGFSVYLTLKNDEDNEVVLSPIECDVYYRSGENYRLIGELTTDTDYVIPANSEVSSEASGTNAERTDENKRTHNINQNIKGLLKISKKSGFVDGANDAFVSLINDGTIDLKIKGSSQYGPISIPFEHEEDVKLNLEIWDRDLELKDVFLYQGETGNVDEKTFIMHTKMQNPSNLPLIIRDFQLDFYNDTDTIVDPLTPEEQVGWGLDSEDIAQSIDPTNTSSQLNEIYLDGYDYYRMDPFEETDLFFAFNYTNPEKPDFNGNIKWFLTKLLDEKIIKGVTIKGAAGLIIGQEDKGFPVDMHDEEDHLNIDDIDIYQQSINTPKAMFENFSVGDISMNGLKVNTKTKETTVDMQANLTLRNPYRFSYDVSDFAALYKHEDGGEFGETINETSAVVEKAKRVWSESEQEYLISPSKAQLPLSLTTTFDTSEDTAGILKVVEDLGGDPDLLNLSNPFWIDKNSPEYEQCPLQTIEYLISPSEGDSVNPMTLMNEVSLLAHDKVYQPLEGGHFGQKDRDPTKVQSQDEEETAMPYIGGSSFPYSAEDYLAEPVDVEEWETDFYNTDIRSPNQYEIIKNTLDDNGDYFPHDDDIIMGGSLEGAIYEWTDAVKTGNPKDSTEGLTWRVYESGGPTWGHSYDWVGSAYGDRGYTFGMSLDEGNNVMASQNFTLDETLFTDSVKTSDYGFGENIEEVTLSASYKYLEESYTEDDAALLFSWFDPASEEYSYDRSLEVDDEEPMTSDVGFGRAGWELPTTDESEWNQFSVDLTEDFTDRLDKYLDNENDTDYLKGEISIGGSPSGSESLKAHFDDIALQIKYKDHDPENSTGALELQELFDYLQSVDSEKGDMFNLFDDLSYEGDIDAVDFWNYTSGDSNELEEGMNFFRFLEFLDVPITSLTDILQNQYKDLEIGEPANFLEALTQTRYRIQTPEVKKEDNTDTSYGPREETDDYWVLEDPYMFSQSFMDTLYRNIFNDKLFSGNELWYLLENFDVSMSWVVMYLLTHGWSKDDIFDVLEALGFGKETKEDFISGRETGTLEFQVELHVEVYGDEDLRYPTFTYDMGDVIMDGQEQIFEYLIADYTDGTNLVYSHGEFDDADSETVSGSVYWGIVSYTATVTPEEFTLKINMDPGEAGGTIASPDSDSDDYDEDFKDDYFDFNRDGLTRAGAKQLAQMLRLDYKFEGETFIRQGGDIVSLFQFLDQYWFGHRGGDDGVDYNSMTLLNAFNVSSRDFVDVITGYNRTADEWDTNENGRADEWRAPNYYASEDERDAWGGWGTNFRDNRLFYNPDGSDYPSIGQEEGAIIWSDSPDFADDDYEGHREGEIDVGTDEINMGAPPIVDVMDMLFWLSETYGRPTPNELFEWLVGELDDEYYDAIDPFAESKPGKVGEDSYKGEGSFDGLTNSKVWHLFRNGSLNPTGFFEWMEKEKSISSFKFLSKLEDTTGLFTPVDLLFFATSPNLVRYIDDSLSFMYHDALNSGTDDPNDDLWDYFDQENFNEEEFFTLLDSAGFNIFDIFTELHIDPASWLTVLDEVYGLLPIEVIKRMKKLDPTAAQYIELDEANGKTVLDISASLTITYSGIELKDIDATIAPDKVLTAKEHFENFIPPEVLRGDNFEII
ncbi:MAG: hypothetical protein R6U96_10585 [Promethearchaeia archaeon]